MTLRVRDRRRLRDLRRTATARPAGATRRLCTSITSRSSSGSSRQARYIHLIRDGRVAAVSFLAMPSGIVTESCAHHRDAAGVSCLWRTRFEAARALGRPRLSSATSSCATITLCRPAAVVERICALRRASPSRPPWSPTRGEVDVSAKPHQQRLRQAAKLGVRNWRSDMGRRGCRRIRGGRRRPARRAGLRDRHRRRPSCSPRPRHASALASYRARTAAWRAAGYGV